MIRTILRSDIPSRSVFLTWKDCNISRINLISTHWRWAGDRPAVALADHPQTTLFTQESRSPKQASDNTKIVTSRVFLSIRCKSSAGPKAGQDVQDQNSELEDHVEGIGGSALSNIAAQRSAGRHIFCSAKEWLVEPRRIELLTS